MYCGCYILWGICIVVTASLMTHEATDNNWLLKLCMLGNCRITGASTVQKIIDWATYICSCMIRLWRHAWKLYTMSQNQE